jgi:hypothetical protein
MAAGYGVAVDNNGNVYVAGGFGDSSITLGGTTLTTGGVFLAKFTSSGTVSWAVAAGGALGDLNAGKSVAVDASGNIYITGKMSSPLVFGSTTLVNTGVFVAKYSNAGVATWAISATTTNIADAASIALDAGNGVYITGNYAPSMNFSGTIVNSGGGSDIFVAKYNTSGTFQWVSAPSGANNDYGYSVVADANNDVYLAGSIGPTSVVPFGPTTISATGKVKAFLTKYGATGNVIWAKAVGGTTSSVSLNGVGLDDSGKVYVAGRFFDGSSLAFGSSTLNNVSSAPLYSDVFVGKFDAAGNEVWGKSAGGPYLDEIYGMAVDSAGIVYTTGWYNSLPLTLDAINLPNAATSYCMFTAQLGVNCSAAPGQPGNITGAATACQGSPQTYSVAAVPGASGYAWTLPAGWTGTSSANSITVTAGTAGGTISVAATNSCGTSTPRTMALTTAPVPAPAITNNSNTLSTTATFASYQWYKNGNIIAGATSQNYAVTQSGNYYVMVTNSSGCSAQSNTIAITLDVKNSEKEEIAIHPTIGDGIFKLSMPGNKMPVTLSIYNMLGVSVQRHISADGTNSLNVEIANKVPGTYLVLLQYEHHEYYERIIIR